MSVANDLQDIVADLSVAIAERRTFGRVELEKLRRQIDTARRELVVDRVNAFSQRAVLADLIVAVETRTLDLTGLAVRARDLAGFKPTEALETLPGHS